MTKISSKTKAHFDNVVRYLVLKACTRIDFKSICFIVVCLDDALPGSSIHPSKFISKSI